MKTLAKKKRSVKLLASGKIQISLSSHQVEDMREVLHAIIGELGLRTKTGGQRICFRNAQDYVYLSLVSELYKKHYTALHQGSSFKMNLTQAQGYALYHLAMQSLPSWSEMNTLLGVYYDLIYTIDNI